MTDELRIGVIGIGGRGNLAHHAHKPEQNVRLVAGADPSPNARDDFNKRFGPDVFVTDDYRLLLERDDIDAVFVTTPDYCHEEHAVAALEAGKAVYLEKPMAITTAGCDRILHTARKTGCRLYLGHNMRHMDFVLKMKEMIDGGAIGEVKTAWCRHFISYGGDAYFRDWHAERRYSNSLLLQKAAHDIDVIHWLCSGYTVCTNAMGALTVYDRVADRRKPDEPPRVWENWRENPWPPLSLTKLNPIIDVEDLNMMQMRLDNGVLASYQQCHYTPDAWRNYTVIGTEGRIENIGDVGSECIIRGWNKRCGSNPNGDIEVHVPIDTGSHGGADAKIVAEFVRFVREGGAIKTSPIAARNSVAAGCAAAESVRNGGHPVDVPPLPDDLVAYFDRQ